MRLQHVVYTCYTLLWIGIALLGIISCKDFEDCRAVYTNVAYIEIKSSTATPTIHKVDFETPYPHTLYDQTSKNEEGELILRNLAKLPIPLHPKSTSIAVLFYKTATDPLPDTLTIFYRTHPGILSPVCGLHQAYVLDSVTTSFAEATIIKPTLRTEDYENGNETEVKSPNVKIRY